MPTITSGMVPTKSPGNLFAALSGGDVTLNVRWMTAGDPVYYEAFNRPLADIVLRQLILAKAIDALSLSVGAQVSFPFLVTAKVGSGTTTVDLPAGWLYDFHVSLPRKWERLRLVKIKRISGTNTTSYTGTLRLLFAAEAEDSDAEVTLFTADYVIDSVLSNRAARSYKYIISSAGFQCNHPRMNIKKIDTWHVRGTDVY